MGLFGSSSEPEIHDGNKWENETTHSIDAADEDRIETLVENAHNGATVERALETNATNPHSPIIHYLDDDEQIAYLLTEERNGVQYVGERKYVNPRSESETSYLVTDERILAVVPQSDADTLIELPYDELVNYKPNIDVGFRKGERRGKTMLTLTTTDWKYRLHVDGAKHADTAVECVHYIRKQLHPSYDRFLVTQGGPEMPQLSLSILDRETGEATMDTGGWNYGLGFVQRHSSTSTIEKEGYTTHASDFVITDTGVQITYQEADGSDMIRMHRSFDQLGSVDRTSGGFILYTSDGIYKFDREHDVDRVPEVDEETLRDCVEYIRSQVETQPQTAGSASDSAASTSDDAFTKLEKLDALREDGVITDEEFEAKKADLLKDI